MIERPNSTHVRMAAYRRILPLAVLAFMGSWTAHAVLGSGIAVDLWLLPTMTVLWLGAWWLASRRVVSVPSMEAVIQTSLAAFFLVKMTFVAWIAPSPDWQDAFQFSLYLPLFFALAYWSNPRRRAWIVSWIFLGTFLVVASPYLIGGVRLGTDAGVGTTLVFVHLAIMCAVMIEFLRAYGDTMFAQQREVDHAERIAAIDELTEVDNRRGLERRLRNLQRDFLRTGVPYSVVFVDLDHFKLVNDTYGHNVGDDVLRRLGRLLRDEVREADRVGRWGGEEFAVVCGASSAETARGLAERLRRVIEATTFPHGVELTASFGVAEVRQGDSIERVVGRADLALYTAKRGGRNRVQVHGEAEAEAALAPA